MEKKMKIGHFQHVFPACQCVNLIVLSSKPKEIMLRTAKTIHRDYVIEIQACTVFALAENKCT